MIELIINYWWLLLLAMLLGGFLYSFNQKNIRRIIGNFSNKAPLIKRYWMFVIPFSIISALLFYIIFKYSDANNVSIYTSLLGQILTLVFAIYAGYLAFLQLIENRFDKLVERGDNYLFEEHYNRALESYQEAHKINPRDFNVLANMTEIYLISQDRNRFDEGLEGLARIIKENSEKLCLFYLKVARFILIEDMGSAKRELGSCINFVKNCPDALSHFLWNFKDIKNCAKYKLLQGEAKETMDNLISYLQKSLNDDQKNKFENGNYLLK
jgi:tetratricopeptide (TPR) repeat protein